MRRILVPAFAVCGLASTAPGMALQQRTATVSGGVTDTAGVPLVGALVEDRVSHQSVRTGSQGEFRLGPFAGGFVQLTVRQVGYIAASFPIVLPPDSNINVIVQLHESTPIMDSIAVIADSASEGSGTQASSGGFFERSARRERGGGSSTFIAPRDVKRRRPQRTSDLLRDIPGLRIREEQGVAVPYGRDGRCVMNIWVNGQLIDRLYSAQDAFNSPSYFRRPATMPGVISAQTAATQTSGGIDGFLPAGEVDAIEVYLTPSEVPPQFDSLRNQCGTIVIWTK